MSHVFLVTKPHGQQVLVAQSGMTIEPDPISDRCVIVFPSKERVTPGSLTVSQPFDHFVGSLERAGMLIRIEPEPEKAPAPAQEKSPMQEADENHPFPIITMAIPPHDPVAEFRAPAAEIKQAVTKNRRKKEKA